MTICFLRHFSPHLTTLDVRGFPNKNEQRRLNLLQVRNGKRRLNSDFHVLSHKKWWAKAWSTSMVRIVKKLIMSGRLNSCGWHRRGRTSWRMRTNRSHLIFISRRYIYKWSSNWVSFHHRRQGSPDQLKMSLLLRMDSQGEGSLEFSCLRCPHH